MPSRTYKEEEVGPQSTNRFVVPREIPTTVVTGAETKLASVQPNLTGKRKLPYQPDDIAEEPDVGKVNSLGEWITAIGGGLSLGMWASQIGVLGKDAQMASSNLLKSSAASINSLLQSGSPRSELRQVLPAYQGPGLTPTRTTRKAPARPKRVSETNIKPELPPVMPINLDPNLRASKNNAQQAVLDANTGLDISSAGQTSSEGGLAGIGADDYGDWQ